MVESSQTPADTDPPPILVHTCCYLYLYLYLWHLYLCLRFCICMCFSEKRRYLCLYQI